MSAKSCEYGVLTVRCGQRAVTKRQRPTGGTWDVCQRHADFLDRLHESMIEDRVLLAKLAVGASAERPGGEDDG